MNKLCGVFRTPRLPASSAPHLYLRYKPGARGGDHRTPVIRMRKRNARNYALCYSG